MNQPNKPGYGTPDDQKQHAREATGKGSKPQEQGQGHKREASGNPQQNPPRPGQHDDKHHH